MKKGFTLVELAIVIVIVGIVVSMIFKGQTIYENSKLRSSMKNIEMIRSALSNIAMDNEGVIPDNSTLDNITSAKWEQGRYDEDRLLISKGLLTEEAMYIYRRPDVKWDLVSCNRGDRGADEHSLVTEDHSGKHVCLSKDVSERFSCYFEKIMDDDNTTNGFARNKSTPGSGAKNFKSCSSAPLSDRKGFTYILY
ncbi:MAG: prepilin-type N-terminal cleavage/methylation domain-containing protein [Deferribacteraceae bacterium]|jgi:prepilin-type N-terminal cleavage/methylation domain-containing protein|nr:prepilin-type N-terminal cleavage/methylation domain-containing protein [Deferribacteraceae bacterium]